MHELSSVIAAGPETVAFRGGSNPFCAITSIHGKLQSAQKRCGRQIATRTCHSRMSAMGGTMVSQGLANIHCSAASFPALNNGQSGSIR
jgi:hypothetical protein